MLQLDNADLKRNGFLPQVEDNHYALRLRVAGGYLPADKLQTVYEIANRYGKGFVHMTSRQSVEIPHIKGEDIEAVKRLLAAGGLESGKGGAAVRTITGCQGNAVCKSGLISTTELAREFDEKYYGAPRPHKFKIGITGCRNNCLKAEENDIGIKGGVAPAWDSTSCNYCGACRNICPANAITVDKDAQALIYSKRKCINCGRCVKVCAKKAWTGKHGFLIYIGGLFGNRIAIGKKIIPIVFDKQDVFRITEVIFGFFDAHGKKGERFRNTLDRVGWDLLKKELKAVVK
ncbi:MAG: 4Fe-4S binding protein [Hyphomonadaceae bacterium]|nr:4Fe-4S binding protein [Clostridia bacterium]